jgi:ABC-type methionine transport system ATPase subunit
LSGRAENALIFERVHTHRIQNGNRRDVFAGLDLTVPAGQHLAIVGGSGVGKTTLLRLANRLEEPDSGRVLLGGEPLANHEATQLRRQVALVTQKPCVFEGTTYDNVVYSDTLQGKTPNRQRAEQMLEVVGIEPSLFEQDSMTLSGGEQQRVCMARSLYHEPKILMLDETTSSLDPQLAIKVMRNLIEISHQKQMTILQVTHEMEKIKLANRVVLLDQMAVAEDRAPADFLANPQTEAGRRFLGRETDA